MEACIRGFSFMPEQKVEVTDLQYVEGGELSRAWKTRRRERLKELESKIWDDFVKEQDVVGSICNDDPYQFLDQLPDDCLKELMEVQIKNVQGDKIEEISHQEKEPQQQTFENEMREPRETMVSFADDDDNDCDIINIFEDDKDDDVSGSGPEAEVINDSGESPCTVRGNQNADSSPDNESPESQCKDKSSENVTNLIETSIYRAKVKELQSKVNLELLSVITTLEAQDLNKIEPQDLPKLKRQCSEFCARYNRIYLYQLKRQIHDMMRHNNAALPFARHTFLRSQMTRALSFQQNLLQALQVFHKWFTQKTPLRECVDSLRNFSVLIHEGDQACPSEVHNEELKQTCQNLDGVLDTYIRRVNHFLSYDSSSSTRVRKSNAKALSKKRSFAHCSKVGPKRESDTDPRLSMYSLDTHRVSSKNSNCKVNHTGGTSKDPQNEATAGTAKPEETTDVAHKKKTPRSRRPLMRAPGGGQRKREKPREADITTMVEAVGMCASSHMSQEDSPRDSPYPSPRSTVSFPKGARRDKTPVSQRQIPKTQPRRPMSPPVLNVTSQEELKLDLHQSSKLESETVISPVIKVQCEKKDSSRKSSTVEPQSPRVYTPDRTGSVVTTTPQVLSPDKKEKERKGEKKFSEIKDIGESSCEVSRLLRRLCGGSSSSGKIERVTGTKNTQLLCFNGSSPRQPSTPQLLRILEETIQKKAPKPQFSPKPKVKDVDRFRMTFNLSAKTVDALFQYRTKFVQHMLSSPMYANSAVGKPWEMIGSVSEQIIDDMLLSLAKEMQLEDYVKELYRSETL